MVTALQALPCYLLTSKSSATGAHSAPSPGPTSTSKGHEMFQKYGKYFHSINVSFSQNFKCRRDTLRNKIGRLHWKDNSRIKIKTTNIVNWKHLLYVSKLPPNHLVVNSNGYQAVISDVYRNSHGNKEQQIVLRKKGATLPAAPDSNGCHSCKFLWARYSKM
jgi:hypothetical protein